MIQSYISSSDRTQFSNIVNNHLSNGWTVVPTTLIITKLDDGYMFYCVVLQK